ncbi:hypothetical protein [Bacillus sp. V59.32b]|uniref:hypothetical protein n=1 Tax=Bacillus sp. V59.32b TaxID=1758642 RepID=UPI000E3CF867|nr:hypothetical protein [Bacillus sp. V59.32b]RFU64219.1 hypothetical protein D0463_10875 [Bacillus sp. V59.32b]
MLEWLSFLFAVGLTIVHLSSRYMKSFSSMPRKKLLSVAGGISVAYVFVHILPELHKHQEELNDSGNALKFFENHVYVISMLGLAVFYGLEIMVRKSRKRKDVGTEAGIFWIHILVFCLYNALIGYLLIRGGGKDFTDLFLYFFALSVHFISNDHGLRKSHEQIYDQYGRWLLSVSVLVGWGIGAIMAINEQTIGLLFAFLAGSIVLNVLKEELPEERESNYWAFCSGLLIYTVLLVFVV